MLSGLKSTNKCNSIDCYVFGTQGLNTEKPKDKETKLFKLIQTKAKLYYCKRISSSHKMEDSCERWKHKEEAKAEWKKTEYDTNSD